MFNYKGYQMNLELIKKYEKEFLHMLHGGKLKYFTGKEWLSYSSAEIWTGNNDLKIVIDDVYCTYRTALAEGKQLQVNLAHQYADTFGCLDNNGCYWQDYTTGNFILQPHCYQIKPEEPEFKIGDYVRYIHTNSPKPLRIVNINCERYYFENAEIILRVDEIEKWEPKEGEVCIFWKEDSEYNRAVIGRLKQILSNGNYVMDYGSGCTVTYSKCMPFTGTLPPHMRESK